jgi:hypothetical protein
MRSSLAGVFLAALLASGCVGIDLGSSGLTDNIAKNAEALNDAHTRSIVSVISKNIIRASEHQPTNYTTMSGIKSSPLVEVTGGVDLDPLGIGDPSGALEASVGKIGRTERSNAEYSINPFGNSSAGNNLYVPLPEKTFSDYLGAGWPPEVLMYLFVGSITFSDVEQSSLFKQECLTTGSGASSAKTFLCRPFHIDGDSAYDGACPSTTSDSFACRFVRLIADVKNGTAVFAEYKTTLAERDCKPFSPGSVFDQFSLKEAKAPEMIDAVERITGRELIWDAATSGPGGRAELKLCKKRTSEWRFQTRDAAPVAIATVRLRSFDDMIYFLGETVRDGCVRQYSGSRFFTYATSRSVGQAKSCDPAHTENISRSIISVEKTLSFAGDFTIRDQNYYISPMGQVDVNDRTGTVLSLLSQLYLRTQLNEFLKAPESTTLRVN